MSIEEKDFLYEQIYKVKRKFVHISENNKPLEQLIRKNVNRRNREQAFTEILESLNTVLPLEDSSIYSTFEYLTEHWDKTCELDDCSKHKRILRMWPKRYGKDITKFCSNTCEYNYRSLIQLGYNNTSHKQSADTKKKVAENNSRILKDKIRRGIWFPCVTNSWAKSRCNALLKNGLLVPCRSSWEAYYLISNQHLQYEKLVIPYTFKEKEHNYIVDFVDMDNKMIFEIKPDKLKNDERNITKLNAAMEWCKLNGYIYISVSNSWFENNYIESILEGQPDIERIKRLLKQFAK
jgi:hypothetical protein